jgi:ankyrin repeat protein
MGSESMTSYELDRSLRALPGARTERLTLGELFEREIAWLVSAHGERVPAAALVIRLGRWKIGRPEPDDSDATIFDAALSLEEAREAIARFHWLLGWEEAAERAGEIVDPRFEAAADAIVDGDAASLRRLLTEEPGLARARSPFGHRATLLQHVAANGIEASRQWQSPKNAVEIARILIDAGAEVDATCDAYRPPPGAITTMGLLVSSSHPAVAGVQVALVETLLDAGAAVDGLPQQEASPVETALSFGYPDAAEALARRGARIGDVVVAAGLGRMDVIEHLADQPGARLDQAFRTACARGRAEAAVFLLDRGADPTKQDKQGFTGLHLAAWEAHLETVEALLEKPAVRGAMEVKNIYGGTVLDATAWAAWRMPSPRLDRVPVIAKLIAAGADVAVVTPRPNGVAAVEALLAAAEARAP